MELEGIEALVVIRHAGNRRRGVVGDHLETGGQFDHAVTVAHPHIQPAFAVGVAAVLDVGQQF
jgi:hypothetical protein